MKNKLGTITILLENRQADSCNLQKILTENGHLIISRTGINIQPKCIEKCSGMIVLIVQGASAELKTLNEKISKVKSVKSKLVLVA